MELSSGGFYRPRGNFFSWIFSLSWLMTFNHIYFHLNATYFNDWIQVNVSWKCIYFHKILISTNINETTEDTDKSHFLDVFQESLRKKTLIQAISINIIIICCDIPISTWRIRDKKCIDMKIHLPRSYIWNLLIKLTFTHKNKTNQCINVFIIIIYYNFFFLRR